MSLAVLVAVAGTAQAQWAPEMPPGCPRSPEGQEAARSLAGGMFQRATAAEDAGDFHQAIDLYSCSFRIVPHPNTLYNLALVATRAGRLDLALAAMESYVQQAPNAINREEADRFLDDVRERLAHGAGVVDDDEHASGPGASPDGGRGDGAESSDDGIQGTGPMEIAGWSLLGAGLAVAAGAGTAFALLAADEASAIEEAPPGTLWDDMAAHRANHERFTALEAAAFAVGGAALITGVILLVLGDDPDDDPPPVAVRPAAGDGTACLLLVVRF